MTRRECRNKLLAAREKRLKANQHAEWERDQAINRIPTHSKVYRKNKTAAHEEHTKAIRSNQVIYQQDVLAIKTLYRITTGRDYDAENNPDIIRSRKYTSSNWDDAGW